jgi:hypothetical protein
MALYRKGLLWFVLAAMFIPSLSHAGTATLTWVAPTQRVDGTAITGALTYRVFGGVQGQSKSLIATTSAVTYTHTSAPNGVTYCYHVTAVENGLESVPTNEVCKAIPMSPPNPPTGLVVGVVAALNMNPVYGINANGTRGTTVIGFVPTGSECYGPTVYTYRGRPYKRVTNVTWWGTAPTTEAAAACS